MTGEVLSGPTGHRPVCPCGWVGPLYPLGHLDTARAALAHHEVRGLAHICHEAITGRDGHAEPCNRPATTTRSDVDGHEYPVCRMHRPRPPKEQP